MDSRQAFHLAALAECPGLGSRRLRLLLARGIDAETLWQMPGEELAQLVPMPAKLIEAVQVFRKQHPHRPEELFFCVCGKEYSSLHT